MTLSRKPPRKPPHFGFWKSRPKVVKFWFGHLQENGGFPGGFLLKAGNPPIFFRVAIDFVFCYVWQ